MQYVTTCKHELYPSLICTLFYVFYLLSVHFYTFPLIENLFDPFFMLLILVSARE